MLPTIALVGRPNVGKSTLFNRLTKSRDALVADFPGLTRDRHYGRARAGEREYLVVDTGGFEPVGTSGIMVEMARQAKAAIAESDAVIFIVDAREGITPQDHAIANLLRKSGRPVLVAVNKAEGMSAAQSVAEFHELGLTEPLPISAAHGENVRDLIDIALEACPPPQPGRSDLATDEARRIEVAVVGRPNVGKSTLVNALLGEERVIAFDEPGTTRDAIRLDFDRGDRRYTLIDTAGVRRRGKVSETVEKFSVIKTMQAIEDANVVILLLDAVDGITEQDAHLAGHILEAGRALTIGINKWDAASADQRALVERELSRKLALDERTLLRVRGVPLVDADGERAARFEDVTGEVRVLLGDAVDGIEQQDHDVRVLDRLQRLDHRELLDRLAHLAATAHAGGVDQRVAPIAAVEIEADRIARRARLVERDHALLAEQRIDQGRLADVGPPDDGDLDPAIALSGG
ncbi:MAG TPA: ribosome biogenesis GTPase Der, partial [Casimicrobiaceae bacterium]|nr:ribosome biogenesis GTPase Der [Casimicrobiaceae bacterium]